MSDIWWLYLVTRLNTAIGVAGVGALVCGLLLIVVCVAYGPWAHDFVPDDEIVVFRAKCHRAGKIVTIAFFLTVGALIVLPSKNDALFIIGGSALLDIAKSDRAKSIGDKTLDAVEQWLAQNLPVEKKP